ncbi:MAG: AAA family ATPase [Spirochaetaceae bacterium]|nr:AAA family ATPase [Spirochaetaceae bacterium]
MLTRLSVSGFKNLVDVDLHLGAFTCVVGPNGAGKSNLFDAIRFLSALANHTFLEAATSVRDQHSRTAHIRDLFHHVGSRYAGNMKFVAEMIVPGSATDDLGQEAKASITFLRYTLELAYRESNNSLAPGELEIVKEELVHVAQRDAARHLPFPHSAKDWRKSVIHGQRRARYFISTEGEGQSRVIKLHQDGGSSGRPLSRPAANLPRTVLSAANATESPTVLTARREMEAWQLVQLEPSAMRQPDEFVSPTHLGTDGRHLAATLYRLARSAGQYEHGGNRVALGKDLHASAPNGKGLVVFSQIANRLGELIDDVHGIDVDLDEKRELMTLYVRDRDGTPHPARALSDGTLRFLALSVLESDSKMQGVICLEEPENGIHPERIPAILELLMDIAVDTQQSVGIDNPLRQVIVNTHSPVVFQQVPDDSVVFVKPIEAVDNTGHRFKRAQFLCLSDTWRAQDSEHAARGDLLPYLNPVLSEEQPEPPVKKRVVDRQDVRQFLLFSD